MEPKNLVLIHHPKANLLRPAVSNQPRDKLAARRSTLSLRIKLSHHATNKPSRPRDTPLRVLQPVPGLVKDMVPVSAHTLAVEQGRESAADRDIRFEDAHVVFWLGVADDEFADLVLGYHTLAINQLYIL